MTDQRTIEPFETQLGDRVRAYTQPATTRSIDPLEVSRTAMAAGPVARRPRRPLGGNRFGRRIAGDRWAAAAVVVLLIGVVAIAVQGRPSSSLVGQSSTAGPSATAVLSASAGAIPDVLRHAWQRPSPVAPGPDVYGSGFLDLTGELVAYGRERGPLNPVSAIAVAGPDSLLVTATDATPSCAGGDVGAYHWIVEGSGTVLTLTPITSDACSAREQALAGPWVRSDLPAHPVGFQPLAPGTYTTSAFDPFADPGVPARLRYTVPAGWELVGDDPSAFVLHHRQDGPPSPAPEDILISFFSQPAMTADFTPGARCDQATEAAGVGRGRDALVAAIQARPSLVSTTPVPVTIGGYPGLSLDLRLAPGWTGGCVSPGAGAMVGAPIVIGLGAGALVGVGPDAPVRLILVDVGDDQAMAVVVFSIQPSGSARFEDLAAAATPIIESLELTRSGH